ncbi:hypothetical protein [Oleidesulfovibrio alaskensis]
MEQHNLFESEPMQPIDGEILLTFKGDATLNHAIDARLYAYSLLGFHNSFAKTNKTLLNLELSIEVIGENEGSFIARIKIFGAVTISTVTLWASAVALGDHYHVDVDSIAMAPFVLFKSTVESIKEAKGNNAELIRRTRASNLPEEAKRKLLNLLANKDFRIALEDFTLILETQGISELRISSNDHEAIIKANDRPYFLAQPEDTQEIEELQDAISVVSISKTDTWKFKGTKIDREFSAEIMDNDFLQTIRLHPAHRIFRMTFSATITKISTTRANKRKPDPPVYTISNIHEIPLQEQASLLLK